MDSHKHEADEQRSYESPAVTDYGTLRDLTEVGGTVAPHDIPHGQPNSAYPDS